ncbi:metallophosphoesterase family protein [Serinicoccus kebangsaanensis]|uniref:metallophosphoesterase family protein n=1 Tax=Serinicoccus kebangsaanensis TaxID=2602069 RepID=UPI00124D2F78|nr:metallophosphoesterase [Serinicoccus kebangsaanensis]
MGSRERIGSVITGLRRSGVVVLLLLLAFVGGVATTQLWPVHTETRYFSADISIEPRLDSSVRLPTVVGDMEVSFRRAVLPAPGLEGQVQVREEVTDLLRQGQLRTADLEPTPAELREAIDAGVAELAWKFAAGALVTTVLVMLAYASAHPARDRYVRGVLASAVATVLAMVVPGTAAYLTYRTDRVGEFRTTSLLSLVEQNTDILAGLDRKADQGAVYVTNLLALSSAMREEFSPESADTPAAARFLLVSDIHGLNQYPLMREIVQTQDIDAVIDAGDIVNFGQADEGDLTGIYQGIESLGVPYIYVRGNHDGAFARDEGMLDRMAQVPNVALVEPTEGELQQISVNGVTVTGFNDSRYFNQRSDDYGADQSALAQRFQEATEGMPLSDIVLTHQPYAADRVSAEAVTVNGHMHAPDLTGQHLQVGSFTGGGLVNQFRLPPLTEQAQEAAEEDPETAGELQGHPYSFDILTFGADCSISSLTRYSYRNLVSGRPQFDDVSLINGRTIQPQAPADRTCSPDLGVSVQAVDQIISDSEADPTTVEVTPPDDAVVTTLPPLDLPEIEEDAGDGDAGDVDDAGGDADGADDVGSVTESP